MAGYYQFLSGFFFLYFDENLGENLSEILLEIVLGEFLAAEILRSRRDPGENLGELLAGEISRSRRDLGENLGENLGEFLAGEISPGSRRDLAGISPRSRQDLEISPAKNSPRFLLRSR